MNEERHLTALLNASGISEEQIELSKRILELEGDTSRISKIKIYPIYNSKLNFSVFLKKDFQDVAEFVGYLKSKSLPTPLEYVPGQKGNESKEWIELHQWCDQVLYKEYILHLQPADGKIVNSTFFLDPEIRKNMKSHHLLRLYYTIIEYIEKKRYADWLKKNPLFRGRNDPH